MGKIFIDNLVVRDERGNKTQPFCFTWSSGPLYLGHFDYCLKNIVTFHFLDILEGSFYVADTKISKDDLSTYSFSSIAIRVLGFPKINVFFFDEPKSHSSKAKKLLYEIQRTRFTADNGKTGRENRLSNVLAIIDSFKPLYSVVDLNEADNAFDQRIMERCISFSQGDYLIFAPVFDTDGFGSREKKTFCAQKETLLLRLLLLIFSTFLPFAIAFSSYSLQKNINNDWPLSYLLIYGCIVVFLILLLVIKRLRTISRTHLCSEASHGHFSAICLVFIFLGLILGSALAYLFSGKTFFGLPAAVTEISTVLLAFISLVLFLDVRRS